MSYRCVPSRHSIGLGRKFVLSWVNAIEQVMRELTGKGFRLNSLKNTGRGKDRRKDKLETSLPKAFRQYKRRYT